VIHGLEDPSCRPAPAAASIRGVTRRAYPGSGTSSTTSRGPQILGDVIAWIDARLAELPTAETMTSAGVTTAAM
jgi:hypothetical protein